MTNDYSCSRATAVWPRGGENVYFREFLNFVVYKNTCKICFRAPLSAVIASIDAPMHPLQRCTRPTAIRGISIFSTFWGRALFALTSPSYVSYKTCKLQFWKFLSPTPHPPPLLPPRHVCPHKKKLSPSEFLQNRTIDDKSTLQAIIQIKKNSVQPFFRNRARRVVGATSRGMYM